MKQSTIRRLILTAALTAVILVLTSFVKIPAPLGYVHIGDAAICLAAALLPTPYAIAAAALGGALSDLLGGYAIYAGFTAVIKALMVPAFTSKGAALLNKRNLVAALAAAVITPVGYLTADAVVYTLTVQDVPLLSGEPWVVAATEALPFNALQGAASLVLFLGVAFALDRLGFKARLDRGIGA